jgi:hypothetical protein
MKHKSPQQMLRAFAFLHEDQALCFQDIRMGCLPLIVLFVFGALVGYFFWGDTGMLWGSGIGLVLGLLSAGWFVWWLRKVREGNQ